MCHTRIRTQYSNQITAIASCKNFVLLSNLLFVFTFRFICMLLVFLLLLFFCCCLLSFLFEIVRSCVSPLQTLVFVAENLLFRGKFIVCISDSNFHSHSPSVLIFVRLHIFYVLLPRWAFGRSSSAFSDNVQAMLR